MQLKVCPDQSEWQAFLEGTVLSLNRASLESHLALCTVCRERLIALYDQVEEDRYFEALPAAAKNRAKSIASVSSISWMTAVRPYMPLALAAALVLAVTFSILVFRDRQSRNETPRVTDLRQSNGTTGELVLTSPSNGAEPGQGTVEFHWTEAEPGARYEFTLTDEKGDILSQQELQSNSLKLDTYSLKLSPSRKYYWSISATLTNGTRREGSVSGFTLR